MENKNSLVLVAQLLIKNGLHLAFAESATAGRLAAEFSMVKDAGKFLKGAFVCYDACLKEDVLEVPHELIERYTPESAEVTKAITLGLQKIIHSDIYIGVTGLPAKGGSESEEKPVGTMFICGFHHKQEIFHEKVVFSGSPEQIILQTVDEVSNLLKRYLQLGFNSEILETKFKKTGLTNMEPFNIRIHNNDEELTLTVLPEKNYYKLIYFGGIIGAIKEFEGGWELLPEEEIEPGGLPFYNDKKDRDDQSKLKLSLPKINQIAAEIENAIH